MSEQKRPLGYLGGDIMTRGSNLARQEEYDKFEEAGIPGEVYSPVQNKSINDKSNMTEEENNCLAEKIVAADVERLWNSDYTVLCTEQSAIGTMCEMGKIARDKNHLNEKDWRRSFSINQFLYGIILAATADGTLHNSFDEILPLLQKEYIKEEQLTFDSEWR